MRQFRRAFGIPVHAFQLQVRVERAKLMLADRMPPAEVALAVGFADQSHLTRRFKSFVGASPAAYQRAVAAQAGQGRSRRRTAAGRPHADQPGVTT